MDFSTTIGKLRLANPLMNASGVYCRTKEDLEELAKDKWKNSAIITKTITYEPREGNPCPRIWTPESDSISINSSGLPNLGYKAYIPILEDISKTTTKPIICSMSPFHISQESMVSYYVDYDFIDGFEFNFSCPNLYGSEKSQNFDSYKYYTTLRRLREKIGNEKHVGCKMSPYFRKSEVEELADVMNDLNIDSVTCINSIPNGLYVDCDTFSSKIVPNEGHGGLGGSIVKATALSNVHWFSKELKSSCSIIGCGGIATGRDLFEHILCGAKAGQIGTAFWKEKHSIFERVYHEFETMCKQKNITSLDQICGRLHNSVFEEHTEYTEQKTDIVSVYRERLENSKVSLV